MAPTGNALLTAPDATAFRTAMGTFPTGVTLLTQGFGSDTIVMTLNSLTSVSLEPLLLLVSVKADGRMRPWIERAGSFAVNILTEEQQDLASEFARPDRPVGQAAVRRLGAVEGVTGDALLPGAAASFACRLENVVEAGDHALLIGRVAAVHQGPSEARPLLFHGGRFARLPQAREAA
ncbi:flavin reductase family protein [Kitasatospora sp. NPDC051170]|uniref:flavin reductase family protein n=1 Tax=Kitasatospora sp. NPDC051170 TaxID=3364056 RepID=UPI0037B955C6